MLRILLFDVFSMRNNLFLFYIWLFIIGYGCISALCIPFAGLSAAMVYSGYGILILWILYTLFLVYKKRKNVIQINNYILIGTVVGITIAFVLLFQNEELLENYISNHQNAFYISSWSVFILFLIMNWIYVQKRIKKNK